MKYKIETYRTGNNINQAETAVRVTHIETGIVAECDIYKSKFHNQETAIKKIEDGLRLIDAKCVTGCKHFYGGELKHHKDCPFYPESMSEMYDIMENQLNVLSKDIGDIHKYLTN